MLPRKCLQQRTAFRICISPRSKRRELADEPALDRRKMQAESGISDTAAACLEIGARDRLPSSATRGTRRSRRARVELLHEVVRSRQDHARLARCPKPSPRWPDCRPAGQLRRRAFMGRRWDEAGVGATGRGAMPGDPDFRHVGALCGQRRPETLLGPADEGRPSHTMRSPRDVRERGAVSEKVRALPLSTASADRKASYGIHERGLW